MIGCAIAGFHSQEEVGRDFSAGVSVFRKHVQSRSRGGASRRMAAPAIPAMFYAAASSSARAALSLEVSVRRVAGIPSALVEMNATSRPTLKPPPPPPPPDAVTHTEKIRVRVQARSVWDYEDGEHVGLFLWQHGADAEAPGSEAPAVASAVVETTPRAGRAGCGRHVARMRAAAAALARSSQRAGGRAGARPCTDRLSAGRPSARKARSRQSGGTMITPPSNIRPARNASTPMCVGVDFDRASIYKQALASANATEDGARRGAAGCQSEGTAVSKGGRECARAEKRGCLQEKGEAFFSLHFITSFTTYAGDKGVSSGPVHPADARHARHVEPIYALQVHLLRSGVRRAHPQAQRARREVSAAQVPQRHGWQDVVLGAHLEPARQDLEIQSTNLTVVPETPSPRSRRRPNVLRRTTCRGPSSICGRCTRGTFTRGRTSTRSTTLRCRRCCRCPSMYAGERRESLNWHSAMPYYATMEDRAATRRTARSASATSATRTAVPVRGAEQRRVGGETGGGLRGAHR